AAEQDFGAIEQLRVFAEGPGGPQLRAPAVADPVAAGIAEESTRRGAGDGVGTGDLTQADQDADREQQRQRGHDGTEDDHRVAERDQEYGHAGGHGMGADPGNEAVEPGTHRRNYGSGRPACAAYNAAMDHSG